VWNLQRKYAIKLIQAEKTGKVDDIVYVDGALLIDGYWNTFFLYASHMKKNDPN